MAGVLERTFVGIHQQQIGVVGAVVVGTPRPQATEPPDSRHEYAAVVHVSTRRYANR